MTAFYSHHERHPADTTTCHRRPCDRVGCSRRIKWSWTSTGS